MKKRSLLALLAAIFIDGSSTISHFQESKKTVESPVVISSPTSAFSLEERTKMFNEGFEIPFLVANRQAMVELYRGDAWENIAAVVYHSICVKGRYNSEFHGRFIDPNEAEFLLESYGWEISP